jgi:hypothetical protein
VRFECDLILKGGITSGVVYPPAICELARDHRFRSIGGASAGAIAAASAAAAELGRGSATGGFPVLADLPRRLAETDDTGATRLRRLFRPQPETADLFDMIWLARSAHGMARMRGILRQVGARGDRPWRLGALAVAACVVLFGIPAIAVVVLTARTSNALWLLSLLPLLVAACGVLAVAWRVGHVWSGGKRLATDAPARIAANFHGLCNGRAAAGDEPALTDWLYDVLQELAGRGDPGVPPEVRDRPVTYGDLEAAGVRLVTMTTDVSRGTSDLFPIETATLAFQPAELGRLLPEPVVAHLVAWATAHPVTDEARAAALAAHSLLPMPPSSEVPIILGARISLSFPVLLSAVPLYRYAPRRGAEGAEMEYVRCWFSDGGITSNLPVHLFDSPLPSRPTYAINLAGGGDAAAPPWMNLFRPVSSQQRHPRIGEIDTTVQFLSAVFDTMQNWSDNALVGSPGFRDRICTIRLDTGEGGMNLDMDEATILGLVDRGSAAGRNLAWMQRGTIPPDEARPKLAADVLANQWDCHRFIRFRSFARALGDYVDRAAPSAEAYRTLAEGAVDRAYLPYRTGWSKDSAGDVVAALDTVFALDTTSWTRSGPTGVALNLRRAAESAADTDDGGG